MTWMPHVDKLILELLANRTQPSCVQSNILVVAKVIHPTWDVIKELPSRRYIRSARTVLTRVAKSLAAMRIGNSNAWKQMHTDETSRRHTSIVNCVMSVIGSDNKLQTICLSGAIIAEDGTAHHQALALVGQFRQSGRMLDEWRTTTLQLFPNHPDIDDLLAMIPTSADLCVSKLLQSMLSTDTCNTAQALHTHFKDTVFGICREMGMTERQCKMQSGFCFQHMRNILCKGVEICMDAKCKSVLSTDLDIIPPHLRIQCTMTNLARMVDKELNPRGDYAKGHGGDFWYYMETYHRGVLWLPIVRVLGGARQDGSFEAALPLYAGRKFIIEYLHKTLCENDKDNILQHNMFIVLESVEIISMIRVAAIFFLSVVVPWRWLAGKTHELAHRQWGEKDMGVVCDIVYEKFKTIAEDGDKMLDEDFMLQMFSPLYTKLPEFKQFIEWYFEEKTAYPVGIKRGNDEHKILAIDETVAEVFYPTQAANRQSNEFCKILAEEVGTRICLELMDPNKSLSMHLSAADGKFSVNNVTASEKGRLME